MPNMNNSILNLALLAIEDGVSQLVFAYDMEDTFNMPPKESAKYYRKAYTLFSCGERGTYQLKYGS